MRSVRSSGLARACCVLLQGLAESRRVKCKDGSSVNLAYASCISVWRHMAQRLAIRFHVRRYIGRKNGLYPGTRYHARGINELGGAGNEIEARLRTHIDRLMRVVQRSSSSGHSARQDALCRAHAGAAAGVDGGCGRDFKYFTAAVDMRDLAARLRAAVVENGSQVGGAARLGSARHAAEALPGESRWPWQVSEPELVIRQDPCNGCELFFAKMRKRCALAPNEL